MHVYRRPHLRRPRRVWVGTSAAPAIEELSGTIAAVASLSGELYRVRPLSGLVPAVASVSANLYLTWGLFGTIAAASTVSANLNPFRGLSGVVTAQAALSGLLYRTRDIDGDVEAESALAANLYVIWALTGTVPAVSYLIATLETPILPRVPHGLAVGDETLVAVSQVVEGLAAQGIVAPTPIPPGRGSKDRTPLATGRVSRLPSGLASGQDVPRSGSAGVAEGTAEGRGAGLYVPPGAGHTTPQPPKGTGRKDRTKEGEAETDRPPVSGKAD